VVEIPPTTVTQKIGDTPLIIWPSRSSRQRRLLSNQPPILSASVKLEFTTWHGLQGHGHHRQYAID
jgi:hypothetical protein